MIAVAPRLTGALRREYEDLLRTCVIPPARFGETDRIVERLRRDRGRYEAACAGSRVPWVFAGIVHELEAGGVFTRHLHNGDPLSARTRRVPKGRPRRGEPPFAWETSAADALALSGATRAHDWSLPSLLYRLEAYNGFGYRLHHPEVRSPYLWAGSQHYVRGKYVSDGRWSAAAVSTQIGGAVLLRRMAELGIDAFAVTYPGGEPAVVAYHAEKPANAAVRAQALELQRWLNTHRGIFLREDGWPGPATAAAYRRVTGHPLPGAPP